MRKNSQKNVTRGTPGMMLLAFATLLLGSALVRKVQAVRDPVPDAAQSLTGLGDTHFYSSLSGNDFYNPALVFEAAPQGIFRRSVNALSLPDARMLREGVESTGQFVVYTEPSTGTPPSDATPLRWFLKAGNNLYVEFGERNHWPPFKTR